MVYALDEKAAAEEIRQEGEVGVLALDAGRWEGALLDGEVVGHSQEVPESVDQDVARRGLVPLGFPG